MLRVVGTLLVVGFSLYTLVACLQTDDDKVRGLPKALWALLIALFPVVGAGAWWFAGRPTSILEPKPRPQRRGPLGPDDDPDFLRGL